MCAPLLTPVTVKLVICGGHLLLYEESVKLRSSLLSSIKPNPNPNPNPPSSFRWEDRRESSCDLIHFQLNVYTADMSQEHGKIKCSYSVSSLNTRWKHVADAWDIVLVQRFCFCSVVAHETEESSETKHCASGSHKIYTTVYKIIRHINLDFHWPSPGDSQWAATTACVAVFRLVGGRGAGRPGLTEWMGEVIVHRVLLIPHDHLRRGGGAFSPEERGEYIRIQRG